VQSRHEQVKNVLFIMCDQLRWDHLSCYGHPVLHTPNIDALAARGVRFDAAFVQSAVCVPSRMSFYTGRYVASHGTTWNHVPFPVSQVTLGEHLRRAGRTATLAGKTHVIPDHEGLRRFGVDPDSDPGRLFLEGGFDELDRYDGHAPPGEESGYADYLRAQGYAGRDPWNEYVVAALDERGERVSGWFLRNAHLPSRVREEHSETAYMTDLALRFIREQADRPWVLHLSYIKPHWPLMAPAPYHAMYRDADTGPIIAADPRTENAHPVLQAYRAAHVDCRTHQSPEFVRHVRPTYMGLVKQVDDHLGRLFAELERSGRMKDTLIVFTSDHGDHLGDHGVGEKELMYEQAVRVPFIVFDPDPRADATRGSVEKRLVEAVDVVPTVLDALGLDAASHLVEGRSLRPLLHGQSPASWRDCAFSELDYSFRDARRHLGRAPGECQAWMARTERWKYVHYRGLRPQLFDLLNDPLELTDLGDDPAHEAVRREMRERLGEWLMSLKRRVTVEDAYVERRTEDHHRNGVPIGVW
jgi:arylsulfatase A-like enzyme